MINRNLVLVVLISFFFSAPLVLAQEKTYEEIVVGFDVPQLIRTDLFVQYDGSTVYLPLNEIFGLLDLHIEYDSLKLRYAGYIINTNQRYQLDLINSEAKIAGKIKPLRIWDYYLNSRDLYLRIDLFDEYFGLKMDFKFSALRVYLPLNKEFPSYQKLKRKLEHESIQAKAAAPRDVKVIPRKRDIFNGGVVDWAVSASPLGGGGQYFDFNAGGIVLGGDISVTGGGNSVTGIQSNQMIYKWHYFFNDNHYLTQADLGNINTSGLFSRGLKGGMITNKPQVERKYFQTLNLADHLGEGWEVELYIDQKLTDFQATDHNGDYNFNVDIYYGASVISLKMYGPNGEIRTEEKYIRIPYNLVPKNNFEYSVAAGTATIPDENSKYAQATSYYGISDKLTLGVSSDLPIESRNNEKPSFGTDATYQMGGNLTVNGSFAPNKSAGLALNYSKLSILNISAGYTKYYESKFQNRFGQQHSVQMAFSAPLKIGGRYLGFRYNVNWDKFRNLDNINMNYGFNLSFNRFQFSYSGRYKISIFPNRSSQDLTSQALLSTSLIPWVQPKFKFVFDHMQNRMASYGIVMGRRVFRTGQLSLSFERNESSKSNLYMLTFNLFTGFANFTSRVLSTGSTTSMSQVQKGSVRYDSEGGAIRFDRRNGVGFGSALIKPFRDDDFDGVRDKNEEIISGIKAKIVSGREKAASSGKVYYYEGLRPYDYYLVQIDLNSIDNPSLKPAHENYKILCDPNIVTGVEVPLVVVSDISGFIEKEAAQGKTGVGGFKVEIMNTATEAVSEVTAFSNGEYYYQGLVPGKYKIYINSEQLIKFGYISEPGFIEMEITPSETNAALENLNFLLTPKQP